MENNETMNVDGLQFKIAAEPEELHQIRALNYRTFVEEIPQHHPNEERLLVDRFDSENIYCICRHGERVIGMIALRSNRPFSLDAKLPGLDDYLPPHKSPCEIRLLAVDPKKRNGRVLAGLIAMVHRFFETRGHDLALISGTLRQTKLYGHLGFQPFGPVVGSPDAPYQPMYQFAESFRRRGRELDSPLLTGLTRAELNLLPGPVPLSTAVREALAAKPISHRSTDFAKRLERTVNMLCRLTSAPAAAIAVGSGTMANDMVAGQLAQIPGRGLVLVNGEFGRRLADHAARFQLDYDTLEIPWGESFTEDQLLEKLRDNGHTTWLWAVHAETSTGVLNDLDMLKRRAADARLTLCLDCVSSLGVVPCDLRGVKLASGVSGKALRSLAGLALVFHDGHLPASVRPLPRYIDLNLYVINRGVPFTISSSLLTALSLSLETLDPETRYDQVCRMAGWLCRRLAAAGLAPLAPEGARFPGAITIPLPPQISSSAVGAALERQGILLSYQSGYLSERNWIQICLMGAVEYQDLEHVLDLLSAEVKNTGNHA